MAGTAAKWPVAGRIHLLPAAEAHSAASLPPYLADAGDLWPASVLPARTVPLSSAARFSSPLKAMSAEGASWQVPPRLSMQTVGSCTAVGRQAVRVDSEA